MRTDTTRRDLGKMALGGAAMLSSAQATLRPIPPGIKIGASSSGRAVPENFLFLRQLGVTWVSLAATPETATADGFIKMRQEWEAAGFDYLVCMWPSEGQALVERFAARILA